MMPSCLLNLITVRTLCVYYRYLNEGIFTEDLGAMLEITAVFTEERGPSTNIRWMDVQWVWEREAHINWSMATCQGSTRSELP